MWGRHQLVSYVAFVLLIRCYPGRADDINLERNNQELHLSTTHKLLANSPKDPNNDTSQTDNDVLRPSYDDVPYLAEIDEDLGRKWSLVDPEKTSNSIINPNDDEKLKPHEYVLSKFLDFHLRLRGKRSPTRSYVQARKQYYRAGSSSRSFTQFYRPPPPRPPISSPPPSTTPAPKKTAESGSRSLGAAAATVPKGKTAGNSSRSLGDGSADAFANITATPPLPSEMPHNPRHRYKSFAGQKGLLKDVNGTIMRVLTIITDNLEFTELPHEVIEVVTRMIQQDHMKNGRGNFGYWNHSSISPNFTTNCVEVDKWEVDSVMEAHITYNPNAVTHSHVVRHELQDTKLDSYNWTETSIGAEFHKLMKKFRIEQTKSDKDEVVFIVRPLDTVDERVVDDESFTILIAEKLKQNATSSVLTKYYYVLQLLKKKTPEDDHEMSHFDRIFRLPPSESTTSAIETPTVTPDASEQKLAPMLVTAVFQPAYGRQVLSNIVLAPLPREKITELFTAFKEANVKPLTVTAIPESSDYYNLLYSPNTTFEMNKWVQISLVVRPKTGHPISIDDPEIIEKFEEYPGELVQTINILWSDKPIKYTRIVLRYFKYVENPTVSVVRVGEKRPVPSLDKPIAVYVLKPALVSPQRQNVLEIESMVKRNYIHLPREDPSFPDDWRTLPGVSKWGLYASPSVPDTLSSKTVSSRGMSVPDDHDAPPMTIASSVPHSEPASSSQDASTTSTAAPTSPVTTTSATTVSPETTTIPSKKASRRVTAHVNEEGSRTLDKPGQAYLSDSMGEGGDIGTEALDLPDGQWFFDKSEEQDKQNPPRVPDPSKELESLIRDGKGVKLRRGAVLVTLIHDSDPTGRKIITDVVIIRKSDVLRRLTNEKVQLSDEELLPLYDTSGPCVTWVKLNSMAYNHIFVLSGSFSYEQWYKVYHLHSKPHGMSDAMDIEVKETRRETSKGCLIFFQVFWGDVEVYDGLQYTLVTMHFSHEGGYAQVTLSNVYEDGAELLRTVTMRVKIIRRRMRVLVVEIITASTTASKIKLDRFDFDYNYSPFIVSMRETTYALAFRDAVFVQPGKVNAHTLQRKHQSKLPSVYQGLFSEHKIKDGAGEDEPGHGDNSLIGLDVSGGKGKGSKKGKKPQKEPDSDGLGLGGLLNGPKSMGGSRSMDTAPAVIASSTLPKQTGKGIAIAPTSMPTTISASLPPAPDQTETPSPAPITPPAPKGKKAKGKPVPDITTTPATTVTTTAATTLTPTIPVPNLDAAESSRSIGVAASGKKAAPPKAKARSTKVAKPKEGKGANRAIGGDDALGVGGNDTANSSSTESTMKNTPVTTSGPSTHSSASVTSKQSTEGSTSTPRTTTSTLITTHSPTTSTAQTDKMIEHAMMNFFSHMFDSQHLPNTWQGYSPYSANLGIPPNGPVVQQPGMQQQLGAPLQYGVPAGLQSGFNIPNMGLQQNQYGIPPMGLGQYGGLPPQYSVPQGVGVPQFFGDKSLQQQQLEGANRLASPQMNTQVGQLVNAAPFSLNGFSSRSVPLSQQPESPTSSSRQPQSRSVPQADDELQKAPSKSSAPSPGSTQSTTKSRGKFSQSWRPPTTGRPYNMHRSISIDHPFLKPRSVQNDANLAPKIQSRSLGQLDDSDNRLSSATVVPIQTSPSPADAREETGSTTRVCVKTGENGDFDVQDTTEGMTTRQIS